MRTTLQIDDEILQAARSLAKAENTTVGRVISDLARKGLRPRLEEAESSGFPLFQVSPDAPPITPEMVKRANKSDE